MKVVVWMLLVAAALAGTFCLVKGLLSLVVVIRRRPYLRRAQGKIVKVHQTHETRSDSNNQMHNYVTFHPEIEFTTELGQHVTFRSEHGHTHQLRNSTAGIDIETFSHYRTGDSIEVFYDPAGEMTPCIATWAGLYGPGAGNLFGGLAFLFAAALIWVCFGDKLMGP
jgi:hypothetical protein